MKHKPLKRSHLHPHKGFTIIEVIFAVVILAFFIYFITNSFVTTKKQHTINSEYLTKAYVADIVIKLLKERIGVNPNFLAGINGLVIARDQKDKSKACLVNPMSGNIKYKNLFDKKDYLVAIKGIPVVSYSDNEKKEGFYFGIVEFKPGSNLFGSDENGLKTFLNIDELEKYSYDLKIDNDPETSPVGIVKNIEVSVRCDGRKEPDKNPFILATKVICPISSLSSAAYQEIQKNLFSEIAKDIYENIRIEMEEDGFSLNVLVAGIERDCKASPFSTMKVINLSMPEKIPDRLRAEEAFKNILVLHCALELYQQAITEIDAELKKVEGQNDVISTVKVMDNSIQKAQWALQIFEAAIDPLENILASLKPGVIEPPDPDSLFNYQVPILVMRYFLSRSENDNNTNRLDRFIQIAEKLPIDYSESLEQAFIRVNGLLKDNYKRLTARQIQKYSKDLLSFYQLVWINSSKLRITSQQASTGEHTRQASATLSLLADFYRGNNYLAGNEFLECERSKMQQISTLVPARFAEILKKIERFNTLDGKLKKLRSRVNKVDVIARGEEEVKLESAPYEVNMEELSRVYIAQGRRAVQEYLERCQRVYEASLMRR